MSLDWRRLPPSHSPLSSRSLRDAFVVALTGDDPRPELVGRLRDAYHADSALLTDRGTDALHLALTNPGPEEGEPAPIALPAYACYDLATAAVGVGASLVLYDLDPETLGPDLPSLTRCLAAGARTVVVAPLYGIPIDWELIVRATAPWAPRLIEDAAQGSGATWRGRPLGALAEWSVLSFGRGKGWTGGAGGALLRRGHDGVDGTAPRLRPSWQWEVGGLARAAGQWLFARPSLYGLPAAVPALHLGETRFRLPEVVRPMRRSAAALLLATWEAAREESARRHAVGAWLRRELDGARGLKVIAAPSHGVAGELRLPVLVERGGTPLARARWARRLGVGPAYPTTLASLPAVRAHLAPWCRHRSWPGAEALVQQLVTLPTHSLVGDGDRDALVREVRTYAADGGSSSRS